MEHPMTWPFSDRADGPSAASMLADRTRGRSTAAGRRVSREHAMRQSAVWACLRLRADLISTMPVDVFRRAAGVQVEMSKPAVLVQPGGPQGPRLMEFLYSTQVDLDSSGNTVGLIHSKDAAGKPVEIEGFDIDGCTFIGKGSKIHKVRYRNEEYDYSKIWHEKQYTVSGSAVGLSPIAYAAMTINGYLSAQDFAADWFGNQTVPGGHLKNTSKVLNKPEAAAVKANFKETVAAGDIWVSGNDWEYTMLSAKASESQFLEQMKFSVGDVCRFLGVPGDMIDADSSTGSITYANVTQRNLQLLIMNIGPAISRREEALSWGLLPQPRYVKLNTAALLRMDLKSRYESYKVGIDSRFLPPSRVLELENMPPLSPEEEAEFARLFPSKAPTAPQGSNP